MPILFITAKYSALLATPHIRAVEQGSPAGRGYMFLGRGYLFWPWLFVPGRGYLFFSKKNL
jgi:hypothetical protein